MLGIGLVSLALGFYLLSYRPNTRRLSELREQIASQRQELVANQNRADDLPKVAFQVAQLKEQLARYNKRMPRQPDTGQFLNEIGPLSQASSLHRWDGAYGSPVRNELFGMMPYSVKFQGEFSKVVTFLRQVEDMTRLTRIRDIEIHSIDKKLGLVEVDMTMNIYFSEG